MPRTAVRQGQSFMSSSASLNGRHRQRVADRRGTKSRATSRRGRRGDRARLLGGVGRGERRRRSRFRLGGWDAGHGDSRFQADRSAHAEYPASFGSVARTAVAHDRTGARASCGERAARRHAAANERRLAGERTARSTVHDRDAGSVEFTADPPGRIAANVCRTRNPTPRRRGCAATT